MVSGFDVALAGLIFCISMALGATLSIESFKEILNKKKSALGFSFFCRYDSKDNKRLIDKVNFTW